MRLPDDAEWIVALPPGADLPAVTHVRGTLLAASRDQLRASGHFTPYENLLPSRSRSTLDTVHVGTWFSVDVAHDHFATVDRLALAEREVVQMTEEVSKKLNGPFVQTLSSTLRTTGLTPWDVLPFYEKVWRRLFVGGALAIAKVGPKDARVVIAGHPLVRYRYHRMGMGRHLVLGVELVVSKHTYVRELSVDLAGGRVDYLLQWV